jgi:hypothetical protein
MEAMVSLKFPGLLSFIQVSNTAVAMSADIDDMRFASGTKFISMM